MQVPFRGKGMTGKIDRQVEQVDSFYLSNVFHDISEHNIT